MSRSNLGALACGIGTSTVNVPSSDILALNNSGCTQSGKMYCL